MTRSPMRLSLTEADLAPLHELIEKLETTPPMTEARLSEITTEAERLLQGSVFESDDRKRERLAQLLERSALTLAALFQEMDRDGVKARKDDLAFQCRMVSGMLDDWLQRGHMEAPHYEGRIRTILRKAGHHDLEARFLAAHDRHYNMPHYPYARATRPRS